MLVTGQQLPVDKVKSNRATLDFRQCIPGYPDRRQIPGTGADPQSGRTAGDERISGEVIAIQPQAHFTPRGAFGNCRRDINQGEINNLIE